MSNSEDSCLLSDTAWNVKCIEKFLDEMKQKRLDSPIVWIGMYVAAASAVCLVAMAADAFNGFRSKKLWIPCKYFSLNAFSLTVLAIAMKLPVDLTSNMKGIHDKLARISSLVFMSTAMGNFMASLGTLENNEIILNLVALSILVTTIVGNVLIRSISSSTGKLVYEFTDHVRRNTTVIYSKHVFGVTSSIPLPEIACSVTMLVLLVNLCSSAVMVPTAKKHIESTYNEMHKNITKKQVEWGEFSGDKLGRKVKRYWVMAASGSPQFVLARSSISGTSGLICLLMLLTLVGTHVEAMWLYTDDDKLIQSNYKWSIDWILCIQYIGVASGIVAPLLRWFLAARFKISKIGRKRFRDEFKIEEFWTKLLVGWRDKSLPPQIQHRQCRKLLHAAKVLLVNICIGVQVLIVLASKLNLLISAKLVNAFCLCFCFCFCFFIKRPDEIPEAAGDAKELNYSDYVILLEGEAQLPDKIMKNLCSEVDKLIQIGGKKQHKNLIRLLKKSANFHGLGQFDREKVPSLHSQEPPNCWSLPVATLMSISIAVSNITADKVTDQLLASVSEGMSLVMLIEKTLDRDGELESIRQAADLVWNELELSRKWGGKDLESASVRGGTNKETLRKLSDVAEKIVTDYTTQKKDDLLMQNPLNWDVKIIAANSMYRITQTILLEHQTDDEVFERLSIIISNILLACFTNLVQVITFKCHKNAIEERVESVRQAATLLGESKEILEILQQRRQLLPSLDPEKAANIDEWRAAFMEEDIENPSASVSEPNEEQTIC